jgi:alkylation response protein AidB-like acyl-CoA dehydrogenase
VARTAAAGLAGPVRDRLAGLLADVEVARWTAARAAAVPGAANIAKLWAGAVARRSAEIAASAGGARVLLHDYEAPADEGAESALVLGAPAVSLVGGVDLVQRDLLVERVLGLPKAPSVAP